MALEEEKTKELSAQRKRPKRPGISDVAKHAAVSTTTVSYILNNTAPYASQFSKDTRERVFKAAEELNYRPNLFASGLRGHVSALFGVFLSESRGTEESWLPQITALLQGVSDASEELDLLPVIRVGREGAGDEQEINVVQRFVRTGVSGILTTLPTPNLLAEMERLQRKKFPFLVIFGCNCGPNFDRWIDVDNIEFGRMVARKLVENGHRKILCVHDVKNQIHESMRIKGFLEVLDEAGIPQQDRLFLSVPDVSRPEGELAFEKEATAVYAKGGYTAIGCLSLGSTILTRNVCATLGIKIPDDVSCVGAEADFIPALPWFGITHVTVSWNDIGKLSVELLNQLIQEDDSLKLPVMISPKYVPGKTLRPI